MTEHETVTIKKSTMRNLTVALVVLLVAVSFAGGYVLGSGRASATGSIITQPSQQLQPQQQAPAGKVQVSADDDPALGGANAPVTVIEFSDFQCPFCARAFSDAVAGIKADYVSSGKVKFVYRDFPLDSIHPQAIPAANAAECANEQGKFWEYHDKLFQNQALLGDANYKAWAKELGLNEQQFSSCYDIRKYDSDVSADFQDGVNAGVSGTPTFFIGNDQDGYTMVVGAQPYSVIKAAIDRALSA
jgi:protein-disulfide isomerase